MSALESLRLELDSLAATESQRQRLESNPQRASEALAQARRQGANNVVAYALSVFNSPQFSPSKVDQPAGTNRHVETNCRRCDGDRMVVYSTRPAPNGVYEEFVPCPDCNPNANTRRMGFQSPDPARVRERLAA